MRYRLTILGALACLAGAPGNIDARSRDERLDPPTGAQADDPLRYLAKHMAAVSRQLKDGRTGSAIQAQQRDIVRRLDAIIEKLQQECSSCQSCSGGGAGGGRPLARSAIVGGPGGIGDLTTPKKAPHQLDNLSDETRKRILQSREQGFPAGYQSMLEEYFRRLAEQRTVGEDELDQTQGAQGGR